MALEILFGLLTGIAVAAYVLVEFALGFHMAHYDIGQYADLMQFVVPLVLLLLGMIKAASRIGAASFGRSLASGLLITVTGSLLATTFMLFYLKSINPQYVDAVIAFERDKLVTSGIPDEIMVQKVNEMRLRYGVGARLIWGFFCQMGYGVAFSIAVSAYLANSGKSRRIHTKMIPYSKKKD